MTCSTLQDFKKFTGKKVIEAIVNKPAESRKEWMLQIFTDAGEANSKNTNYSFGGRIINRKSVTALPLPFRLNIIE